MASVQAASPPRETATATEVDTPKAKSAPEVASSEDNSPASKKVEAGSADDVREAPVRRQLKETSIEEKGAGDAPADTDDGTSTRGRTSRKRSFESVRGDALASEDKNDSSTTRHVRKRSRDADADDDDDSNGEAKRRSLDEKRSTDKTDRRASTPPPTKPAVARAEDILVSPQQGKRTRAEDAEKESNETNDRATKKRPQSPEKKITSAAAKGNGFANFSSKSPFAALSSSKTTLPASSGGTATEPKQTAPSAFAASGFASLANSATSPFASLAAKTDGAKQDTNGVSKPSGFAALAKSSVSPFATGGSSFGSASSFGGKLGAAFGSSSSFGPPLGGGLKSFASPKKEGSADAELKPASVFGAPATANDDDENDDDDENGSDGDEDNGKDKAVVGQLPDKQDDRFHEQEIETGEESEDTVFSARAKLFIFDKTWKERGVGTFKVNVRLDDRTVARFIMRAEGSHRVVLNSPIKKGVLDASKPPTDQSLRFMGITSKGLPQLYNIRIRNKETTSQLFDQVVDLQALAS